MTAFTRRAELARYRRRLPAHPDLGPARGIALAVLLGGLIWALVVAGLWAWLA